jgi:hypothetical protein
MRELRDQRTKKCPKCDSLQIGYHDDPSNISVASRRSDAMHARSQLRARGVSDALSVHRVLSEDWRSDQWPDA